MEVSFSAHRQLLTWDFTFDNTDGKYTDKIHMDGNTFSIKLPKEFSSKTIHEDHLALITILVAHPFVGTELNLPFHVSKEFAEITKSFTSYSVRYRSTQGTQYQPTLNSVPGLAFSGGADSTAALLVMPETTVSVFMDRPLKKKTSLYNKTAAYTTIKHAQKLNFEVHSIESDVEYIRRPLGFSTDLVPAIPLLAIAQQRNIDSIAFGTVIESAYRIGHEKARDYAHSHHYKLWGRLFKAASVPLYMPVSGVSEVGTSMIVKMSSFHPYTRSCIRGVWPDACENCWKCFRKNMLEEKFTNGKVSESYLERGLKIKEVKIKMDKWPVSHENVIAWALMDSIGPLADFINKRLEGSGRDLKFLTQYYPPSLELIPQQHRANTEAKLRKYLDPMDGIYFETVTKHSMTEWLNSEVAILAKKDFDKLIFERFSNP